MIAERLSASITAREAWDVLAGLVRLVGEPRRRLREFRKATETQLAPHPRVIVLLPGVCSFERDTA